MSHASQGESVTANHEIDPAVREKPGITVHIQKDSGRGGAIGSGVPETPSHRHLGAPHGVRSPLEPMSAGVSTFNFMKGAGQYDVYENDEMLDYLMDDIDEMSICEGSRQN